MKNTLLTTLPNSIASYSGYYMLSVDSNLNAIHSRYTGCRETFCASLRHKHNGGHMNEFSCINTKKLYVLITLGKPVSGDSILTKMTKSLKLVNSFERYYKWPLSKIRPVNDKRKYLNIPSILFTGNSKWGISPYLVSFYTLLLRIGKYSWLTDTIVNEGDHKELVKKLKKVCNAKQDSFPDAGHIYTSINMANTLISNYNKLFRTQPKKYHWSIERINNGGGYNEGIRLLADGNTRYQELYMKCKAFQVKKK